MKLKKLLISIISLMVVFGIAFSQSVSYAATSSSLYVGLSGNRQATDKIGSNTTIRYKIGEKTIWDFITYSDATGSTKTKNNLYCVKAGKGFTSSESGTSDRVTYNQSYDLKTQKSEIASSSSFVNYKEVVGTYYNQILWILDNMYITGTSTETEKTALLEAAGIDTDGDVYKAYPITDSQIEIAQQLAIWHFTNYGDDDYDIYSSSSKLLENVLKFATDGGISDSSYTTLATFNQNSTKEGPIRAEQIVSLYEYLITAANKNASSYSTTTSSPFTLNTTTLNITESGENYLAGPINITKNNNTAEISLVVTNKDTGKDITSQVKFVDANGKEVTDYTGQNIYIQIPTTVANNITVTVKASYKTTTATLWASSTTDNEQPLVDVERETKTDEKSIDGSITPGNKEFDLALRKFISAVSDDATIGNGDYITSDGTSTGTYTRAPQVSYTNGAIKYTHTKEALEVANGDYIEYTLRIFNEGEIDGYAEEITDYILNNQGLQFVSDNSVNKAYGWVMYDSSGNVTTDITKAVKIKTDYLSKANGTTTSGTNSNLIKAFDTEAGVSSSNPDYRDIKIVFKVTEANSSENTLVNIAEISKDYNEEDDIDDKDSTPGTDNQNYPNNGWNTENHEDDIDYEPVVLQDEKEFDLALKKFIAAVSSDATIEEGEYLTDTGNSSGTYTRAPVVTGITNNEIQFEDDAKNPYSVQNGDYVLYTIRVYNDGQTDGYASEIKDELPEGLEFVATDMTYNSIWTIDTTDSTNKTITTDNLAKGKGAELDSVEGETAYTANLLKALTTDENGTGTVSTTSPLNPDYRDVQVLCKVTESNTSTRILVNNAQISDDSDADGNPVDDVDSTPDNNEPDEDDQDLEKVQLKSNDLDLALRKFITSVDGVAPTTSREPEEDVTKLVNGPDTTATYNHTKTPLTVEKGSKIIYTIRVYNEGDVDGYASKITDHLPEYLTLTENSDVNTKYGWTADTDGKTITTDYLKDTVLKAFDKTENKLYYQEVQIECTVTDTAVSNQYITNIAEISEYKDSEKTVINPDRDSTSDNANIPSDMPGYKNDEITKDYVPGQEDDDDFEKVIIKGPGQYDVVLVKEDENGEQLDSTATFDVNGEEKQVTGKLIIADDVEINKENVNTADTYTIKETAAPDGYCEFDGTITITVEKQENTDGTYEVKQITYTVTDEDGNKMDTTDATVKLNEDGNIYVEVKDYEEEGFDLALRKFITGINDTEVTTRVPQVSYENGKITYTHPKDVVDVAVGNIVTYTIRVYNEGSVDGYASEIADDIPDYLEFLPENETNTLFGWVMYDEDGNETDDVDKAVEVRTTYLSKENCEERDGKCELYAFDPSEEISDVADDTDGIYDLRNGNPDYADVQIAFKVKDPGSSTEVITNQAQITDDTDADGNPIDDIDSIPDEWNEGEDDQDYENVEVKYFDLNLLKYVSQVIVTEDGTQKITETGNNGSDSDTIPKVEINRKKIDSTVVKFVYTIQVANEGEIAGYAKEITDYIPDGLQFIASDNPQWTDNGDGSISTRALENTLLEPGETAPVTVTFTWINGSDNLGLKTNTAEISEDYNDLDAPDIDSTPDNKVTGEDDIDTADVLLSISTGIAKTFVVLATAILMVLASGITIIRKFVL